MQPKHVAVIYNKTSCVLKGLYSFVIAELNHLYFKRVREIAKSDY
jgi:hypothetical protein